jgi:hypothetical protein
MEQILKPTGNLRIYVKNNSNTLQQEFMHGCTGDLIWREIPIYMEKQPEILKKSLFKRIFGIK